MRAKPSVEVAEVTWTPADPGARAALLAVIFAPADPAPLTSDPSPQASDAAGGARRGSLRSELGVM